ncbi:MAG: hypothetical protein ACLUAU_00395 [Veillonella nakazawae]
MNTRGTNNGNYCRYGKKLRDMTGAGMMDAKALVETDGNIDKAVDLLREKVCSLRLKSWSYCG